MNHVYTTRTMHLAKTKKVLFLRQDDDFAVSCQDQGIANKIIETIDKKMTIKKSRNAFMIQRY